MLARRALGGALLAGAVGCHPPVAPVEAPPRPPPVAVEAPPLPPPPPTPPTPVRADRCAAYQAENPAPRRFCAVTDGGGMWAVTVDDEDAALVVHEDAEGHRTSATFPRGPDQGEPSRSGEEEARLFDFDGDGDPELFFKLIYPGYEERVVRRVFVTARGGHVAAYPAAPPGVDELRDVDADGRPDAVVRVEHGAYKGCDYCTGSTLQETFVAHSHSDGTFSFTDEAARGYVRERCPARPRGPLVDRDESVSWKNVACSRIWGVPRASIVARLRAECAAHAEEARRCEGPCRHLEGLKLAADFDPLTLL